MSSQLAHHSSTAMAIGGVSSVSLNSWWRHRMETFAALLAICTGNSPVTGELPAQRPLTLSFGVFFDLHLNKRLSKRSWGWWFQTPSAHHAHYDVTVMSYYLYSAQPLQQPMQYYVILECVIMIPYCIPLHTNSNITIYLVHHSVTYHWIIDRVTQK